MLWIFVHLCPALAEYTYETISCASIEEATQITPTIFSDLGIAVTTAKDLSEKKISISYQKQEHNIQLMFPANGLGLEETITQLYPHHIRQKSKEEWIVLHSNHTFFARQYEETIQIYSNAPPSFSHTPPKTGCDIKSSVRFPPFLHNNQKKEIHVETSSPIVSIQQPLLINQKEPLLLLQQAQYLKNPSPLPISLSYAPLVVQLNFSPMYWLYHSAFPLQQDEREKLFEMDPFASGTLVVFDIQHGAPEPYPSLLAIPFKGWFAPTKKKVDEKLKQIFHTAQFDYRKGELGYRWREWELVPVRGGLLIGKSTKMLSEAITSLQGEESWPLFNSYQQDFFSKYLIGMHYRINTAADKEKIRINTQLPREVSVGLTPLTKGWDLDVRSDLKGPHPLNDMISYLWSERKGYDIPLHPIAKDMLFIAGKILTEENIGNKHISHTELQSRQWIKYNDGVYSVHPTAFTFEVHYCSLPNTKEALHFTWKNGVLYQNPKPCDL